MSNYLPIIISAIVIFTALMWWLLALGSLKRDATPQKDLEWQKDAAPPKTVSAPPVDAMPSASAKLMDDPEPARESALPKAQAPLKAAATRAAPTKAVQPAATKATAPKTVGPKAAAPKSVVATAATPKAIVEKPAAAKPAAAKATPPAKPAVADNLLLLKGVGPKVNAMLRDMGITSFAQVAAWSAADVAEIDPKLGAFAGRIGRDNWVDQARFLASGDVTGFQKKYGALGSEAKG